jgi:hypothetical protein
MKKRNGSLAGQGRKAAEPNRPTQRSTSRKSNANRPGRKVGVRSSSGINDMMILDPADESAVEKETQKCSADLEERLSEITKDEIENAVKLSKRLRKRCDYFQAACKQKQDNIEKIRQEIKILRGSSLVSATHSLEEQKKELDVLLQKLQSDNDGVVARSEMLEHMYKRINRDLKTVDKQMITIQANLRTVAKKYGDVYNKHMKTMQKRDVAVKNAARLEAKLQKGKERQHAELLKIDRVIYESKVQRQKIKESVQSKDKSSSKRATLGAMFISSQLQASLVGQKIKDESEKMDSLSQAFAKIQNSTGLSDVNEIVQKFLTRDETYESLCKSAETARTQIEDLRKEHVTLNSQLNELQSGGGSLGNRELYKEVDGHEKKLNEAQRQYRDCRDRNMKLQVLLEECRSSIHKFLTILDPDMEHEKPAFDGLVNSISSVESRVTKMLDMVASSLKNPLAKHGSKLPSSQPTETPVSSKLTPGSQKGEKMSILATPQADELIFQSIMHAKPDVTPRNVRVEKQKSRQGEESAVATIMGYDVPVLAEDEWDANSMMTPSSIDSSSEEESDDDRPVHAKHTLDRRQLKKHANKVIEKHKKLEAKEKSPEKSKSPARGPPGRGAPRRMR